MSLAAWSLALAAWSSVGFPRSPARQQANERTSRNRSNLEYYDVTTDPRSNASEVPGRALLTLDQGSVLAVRVFGSLSIYFTPQLEVDLVNDLLRWEINTHSSKDISYILLDKPFVKW